MAERFLRTRIKNSSGSGRHYVKCLYWGIRWEVLRSAWFSRCGRLADADEALVQDTACSNAAIRDLLLSIAYGWPDPHAELAQSARVHRPLPIEGG